MFCKRCAIDTFFLLLPCEDAIYIFLQLNRKLKFLLLKRFLHLMFIAIVYKLMFISEERDDEGSWLAGWLVGSGDFLQHFIFRFVVKSVGSL